jgi:hypothetical protein
MANETPTRQSPKISPIELFSSSKIKPKAQYSHTFGSPVYVLDDRLQQGKRIPKWSNRARVGVYLGSSPRHSRKVALVLNLATGHVSPQFHVRFDDLCDTLRPSSGTPFPRSHWQAKAGLTSDGASDDESIAEGKLSRPTIPPTESVDRRNDDGEMRMDDHSEQESSVERQSPEDEVVMPSDSRSVIDDSVGSVASSDDQEESNSGLPLAEELQRTMTRLGRVVRLPEHLNIYALIVPWEVFHDGGYQIQDEMADPIAFHPFSLAASSNPDILYLHEAMAAPDSENFRDAMKTEVDSHTDMRHWVLMKIKDLPLGAQVLPAV